MPEENNPALPYPNSSTSPTAPISVERSAATIQTTSPSTSVVDRSPGPNTSVNVLRKLYGPDFAKEHGDNDTLTQVLGDAGAASLDDYLAQNGK